MLDPAQRYANADEMLNDLERFIGGGSDSARRRRIADEMQRVFGDSRQRLNDIVRRRLEVLRSESNFESQTLRSVIESIPPEPSSVTVAPLARRDKPATRWGLWGAAAAVVIAGAAAVALQTQNGATSAPVVPADGSRQSADSGALPATSMAPATIEIYVVATPATATISIDGKPVVGNPHTSQVTSDDKQHTIRIEAAGHNPVEHSLQFGSDVVLNVALKPSTVSPSAQPPTPDIEEKKEEDDATDERRLDPVDPWE